MVTKGDRYGGGMDWGFGDWQMHTEVYAITIHQANGALPYSRGNSTQQSMIIYVGEASEREWMCIHV